MSLNRYERLLFDYIESVPEEGRYWKERVKVIEATADRREAAALSLNAELWDYFEERSRNESRLQAARGEDGSRLSMLNLSEYLLRMWGAVRPKQQASRKA